MSRYGYLEVCHSPLNFEITRVDCISLLIKVSHNLRKHLDYLLTWAPHECSYQSTHEETCILGYPKCAKGRFWSDCTFWPESSLGAHVRRYAFWHCGPELINLPCITTPQLQSEQQPPPVLLTPFSQNFSCLYLLNIVREWIHFQGRQLCQNNVACFLKRGLLQKERICSRWEQILSFWSRPLFYKGSF